VPHEGWRDGAQVIEDRAWEHPDAVALREARRREIAEVYGHDGSEPAGSEATGGDVAAFVVAYDEGRAVGCGGLRVIEPGVGEVKRMYVVPASRGTGVSTAVLQALEARAIDLHVETLRLETGDLLIAAQHFYQREGFTAIRPFGPYVGSAISLCFEKQLTMMA
jgi:putative acetyltransferase